MHIYLKPKKADVRLLASGVTLSFAMDAQKIKNFGLKLKFGAVQALMS